MTNVWIPNASVNGGPANDATGYSFRDTATSLLAGTGGSPGQIRLTVVGNPATTFDFDHVSIGVADVGNLPNTLATPIEILFSGSSGLHFTGAGPVVSDWSVGTLTFASTDTLLYIFDAQAGGTNNTMFSVATNGNDQKKGPTSATWNVSNALVLGGWSGQNGLTRMVSLIETQPSAAPPTVTLMGAISL